MLKVALAIAAAVSVTACVGKAPYSPYATSGIITRDLSLTKVRPPLPRVVDEITVAYYPNSYRVDVGFPPGTPWYAPNLHDGCCNDN
jgi:hypothetical protein